MSPTEIVSNTLFYRAPDGRVIFRPWGTWGPCYLLTEPQRKVRSRIQLAYYCALLAAIVLAIGSVETTVLFGVLLPLFAAGNYLLFWLFTRGLSTTEPPSKPSPEYVRSLLRSNNRAWGRPFLWLAAIVSGVFSSVGLVAIFLGAPLASAIAVFAFFGVCAAAFAWQLRNQ